MENTKKIILKNGSFILRHWNGAGYTSVDINVYPDNVPMVKVGAVMVDTILVRPVTFTEFMAAMFWVDAYVERGNQPPRLFLPFVPGARQDRLNDKGDYLFTAKSVAKIINDRNFPEVRIVDPHSEVISGMIDRCKVSMPELFGMGLSMYDISGAKMYDAVLAPDAGAAKRAQRAASELNLPCYQAWKKRDVSTGAISGFGHQEMPGVKRVLIVDDICDGGGTFTGLAQELKKSGISCDLFVTHGIFSKGVEVLKKDIDNIFTTDSIIQHQDGVNVLTILNDF